MADDHSVRRDLNWAVQSPPLIETLPPHFSKWAASGAVHAQIPETLIAQRRTPIGRYFESLIALWLRCQPEVSDLEANMPIVSDGRTRGEVDLLFRAEDLVYHWELAIKLYLGTGKRSQARDWFGPLGRDRLDIKLNKLQSHQLRLLETDAGRALLRERGYQSVESHALVKGYLFHPFAAWRRSKRVVPGGTNAAHCHGWWVHLCHAHAICERSQRWKLLPKEEWLAPAQAVDTLSSSELVPCLREQLSADPRPPLVAALDDRGMEVERGFIVPDDWAPEPTSEM